MTTATMGISASVVDDAGAGVADGAGVGGALADATADGTAALCDGATADGATEGDGDAAATTAKEVIP